MTQDEKNKASHAESNDVKEALPGSGVAVSRYTGKDNFTEARRKIEGFEARIRRYGKFLREIPRNALIVFFGGLALAGAGELLTEYLIEHAEFHLGGFLGRVSITLLKDAGIAISVSAIAFFGYELIRSARGDFDRSDLMDGTLESLDEATKKLQETQSLQSSVSSLSAQIKEQQNDLKGTLEVSNYLAKRLETIIDNINTLNSGEIHKHWISALQLIFASELGGEAFCKSIEDLVKAARELKDAEGDRPDIQQYLTFLGWLIEQVPSPYAKAFSDFITKGGYVAVSEIPTPKSMASEFLTSYMRLMKEGDEYLAVSDILFWDAGLWQSFQKEIISACRDRGVKSRRIFNICSYSERLKNGQLTRTERKQAQERIRAHLELQTAAPENYEIRYFGLKEASKVADNPEGVHRLATMAFGIFLYDYKGVTRNKFIRAEDPESVSRITFDRNVNNYRKSFEEMWEQASSEIPSAELDFHRGEDSQT